MPSKPTVADATRAIDRHGTLLLYPVHNASEPLSLWHVFYPRSPMRWDWSDEADERVVELWHLRERLARSRKAVYAKWLSGRATFFSRAVFTGMLAALRRSYDLRAGLSPEARELLQLLDDDSPQPTRRLREAAGLAGREHEGAFSRASKQLWSRLLIVGDKEIEEGGFPSLAVGSTELLLEDLWTEAAMQPPKAAAALDRALAEHPSFARAWRRLCASLPTLE